NHSWGGYHWARTSNPFTLKLGDNVSSVWDPILATTSSDWTQSTVLNTTIVAGSANPKNCRPTTGRVEVCNSTYGNNGWLGLAQIWITGGVHITQGVVKNNDTYFNTAKYNTTAWRNLVMCQEVGHTLGLDHQDETFDNPNLGTCMDYTNDPSTNQHPNQHDYNQLVTIYSHLDSSTTVGQIAGPGNGQGNGQGAEHAAPPAMNDMDFEGPGQWGRLVREARHTATYELDFGRGNKVVTFVIWADEDPE
ncbi:MAG: hypothetical protein ABI610_11940, partial [Acidobacteriota bacterium]